VSPKIGFLVRLIKLEREVRGAITIPRAALVLHRTYTHEPGSKARADAFIAGIVGPGYVDA